MSIMELIRNRKIKVNYWASANYRLTVQFLSQRAPNRALAFLKAPQISSWYRNLSILLLEGVPIVVVDQSAGVNSCFTIDFK